MLQATDLPNTPYTPARTVYTQERTINITLKIEVPDRLIGLLGAANDINARTAISRIKAIQYSDITTNVTAGIDEEAGIFA